RELGNRRRYRSRSGRGRRRCRRQLRVEPGISEPGREGDHIPWRGGSGDSGRCVERGRGRGHVAEMLSAWGSIDILVNNAGIQQDAPFIDMTLEQWNRVLGVNLTGMFLCARAAAHAMVSQSVRPPISGAAGKIICVSSVHEAIPWAGHANYAASKG